MKIKNSILSDPDRNMMSIPYFSPSPGQTRAVTLNQFGSILQHPAVTCRPAGAQSLTGPVIAGAGVSGTVTCCQLVNGFSPMASIFQLETKACIHCTKLAFLLKDISKIKIIIKTFIHT